MSIIEKLKNYFLSETDFRQPKAFSKSLVTHVLTCIFCSFLYFIILFLMDNSSNEKDFFQFSSLVFFILSGIILSLIGFLPFSLSFLTLHLKRTPLNITTYIISILYSFIFSYIFSKMLYEPHQQITYEINLKIVGPGIGFGIISCAFILYNLKEKPKKESIK